MNRPPELVIRNLTQEDLAAADIILASSFGATASRKDELARYLAIQPDGWLLGLSRNQPVGLVGAVNYTTLAYIGLMAVSPDSRRQGIGRSLMKELLSRLDNVGCPEALLDATGMGQPLYSELGFLPEGQTLAFIKDEHVLTESPVKQVERIKPDDIQSLVAFDWPIFGANRERVFNVLVKDFPGRGYLARDKSGRITGFIFGQAAKIGPWVAENAGQAEVLLKAVLSLHYEHGPRLIAPSANKFVNDILFKHGFRLQQSCAHMRRGGLHPPGQRQLIYGQASYAIG
jgi:predicted N-acetyltransferase YhbS